MPHNYNLADNILSTSDSESSASESDDDSVTFKEFEKRHQASKAAQRAWGLCEVEGKKSEKRLFPKICLEDNALDDVVNDWLSAKKN